MPAILFFQKTCGAWQSLGTLWICAEILDSFGGMFGATDFVIEFIGSLLFGIVLLHKLSYLVIINNSVIGVIYCFVWIKYKWGGEFAKPSWYPKWCSWLIFLVLAWIPVLPIQCQSAGWRIIKKYLRRLIRWRRLPPSSIELFDF